VREAHLNKLICVSPIGDSQIRRRLWLIENIHARPRSHAAKRRQI